MAEIDVAGYILSAKTSFFKNEDMIVAMVIAI